MTTIRRCQRLNGTSATVTMRDLGRLGDAYVTEFSVDGRLPYQSWYFASPETYSIGARLRRDIRALRTLAVDPESFYTEHDLEAAGMSALQDGDSSLWGRIKQVFKREDRVPPAGAGALGRAIEDWVEERIAAVSTNTTYVQQQLDSRRLEAENLRVRVAELEETAKDYERRFARFAKRLDEVSRDAKPYEYARTRRYEKPRDAYFLELSQAEAAGVLGVLRSVADLGISLPPEIHEIIRRLRQRDGKL